MKMEEQRNDSKMKAYNLNSYEKLSCCITSRKFSNSVTLVQKFFKAKNLDLFIRNIGNYFFSVKTKSNRVNAAFHSVPPILI